MALDPLLIDQIALIAFLGFSLGYHVYYVVAMRRDPGRFVRARMHAHRLNWTQNVLKRGERIAAVQALRNLIMTNTFLASTMILLVAFVANYFILEPASQPFEHPRPTLMTGAMPLTVKGFALLIIYAFAFVMFLSSLRDLSHLSILVGVEPDQVSATEGREAGAFMAEKLNQAESMTTYGRRAVYFSIPLFAWLYSPWIFLLMTLAMWFYFVVFLDFDMTKKVEAQQEPGRAGSGSMTPK